MQRNSFLNWLGQVLLGFTLVGADLEVGLIFGMGWWYVALPCGIVALAGIGIVVHAELKERPHRRLRHAQRTLVLPTQWSVKFGARVPEGGTVAIAVIRSDGVRFVIDIREETSAHWGTPVDGSGKTPLVGPKGKPLTPDPIGPLSKAAMAASAAPVLWLPNAATSGNLRHPDSNLIVVMGNARDLKHALQGAEIVPLRKTAKVAAPAREKAAATAKTATRQPAPA